MDKGEKSIRSVADRLLAEAPRNPEAPHYTEQRFERKRRDMLQRLSSLPLPAPNGVQRDLLLSEWAEVIRLSGINERQVELLRLRYDGWTFEEIGRAQGVSKQAVAAAFGKAAKRLALAWSTYPYRGLAEVYSQEVHRRSKGRPWG